MTKKETWENLLKGNCIYCNNQLKFRRGKTKTRIAVRHYQNNLQEDMFFCFRCNFQIGSERMRKMVLDLKVRDGYFNNKEWFNI